MCDNATNNASTAEYCRGLFLSKRSNYSNVTQPILNKLGISLHNLRNHPLEIIKRKIYSYFGPYETFDHLSPLVRVEENFDLLLIPSTHAARSKSDTYYVNETTVLRTHTSAHQSQLLSQGKSKFLVTGDVYRKDEIDRRHYPVFHQMEGVCLVPDDVDPKQDLVEVLTGLVKFLFGNECQYRINPDYFPFTDPSLEIEVLFNGAWLEVLGCGVIHKQILDTACGVSRDKQRGWAFGLGLERLAMVLFKIPDIRLFWSEERRFLDQFAQGQIVDFVPYPCLNPVSKDLSFWILAEAIDASQPVDKKWKDRNEFFEICRAVGGDNIERIELAEEFVHPRSGNLSHLYRIWYQPTDSSMTNPSAFNDLANDLHNRIRAELSKLNITLR